MADKGSTYETKSDVDGIEELSKKLTSDLRKHIRSLGAYDVLTEKWNKMADSLARIANISEMEKKLPKESDESTLWECEELALRYLLEDGKLNLCLRLLESLLEFQAAVSAGTKTLTPAEAEQVDKFEQGVGLLLGNAWLHVEALQTSDLPLLIKMIGTTLDRVTKDTSDTPFVKRQPVMILYYVRCIGRALEKLDETRIFAEISRYDITAKLVAHLAKNYKRMTSDDISAGAEGLALMFSAEDFRTHKKDHINSVDVHNDIVALDAAFIKEMSADFDVRRVIRPVMDQIEASKREIGSK